MWAGEKHTEGQMKVAFLVEIKHAKDWRNTRRLLKSLLRWYHIKCIAIRLAKSETTKNPKEENHEESNR